MDKINISQLSYSKHCILVHNNREYFINYRPIKNCIEILLSNSEILQHFIFKYENKKNFINLLIYISIKGKNHMQNKILENDVTTTDTLGKSSLHPIYISLGNIPTWRRNKEDAKQLLGYFPILFAKNEKEKISPEFKKLVRKTFHKSLKFLLDPLFENENEIDYKINNRIIWFFSKISTIIDDWPEAYTYLLTYKSTSLNFPCHFCLVQKNDLIDTMQDQIILRNHENMMEHFNNNTGHSVSLKPIENYFWNIPNLNIYVATVSDRMHYLDLGLYHYQIEFTKGILGRSSIDKMNERIGAIPRYLGLKIFSKGLQSIARLTASEHRDLMKVMVFVVDGLLSNDLSEVYVKWNEMYILISLKPIENYFWNIPNLNIYVATVSDRMHYLDLGLYHYQIEFTKGILGRSSIDKMNERIGAIPRYLGLKIFSKGLQSIARLTASEHRDLMKVMVFVVDGLLSNDLSEVYVKWNEMYILSRLEIFKKSDLEKFQKAINDWADLFVILFRKKSDSKMKFPKFHSWIFHIVDTIREYRTINGYTTETYESLHKSYVKTPYCLSNKKDVEKQIMQTCLDSFFDMLEIISAKDCRIKIFGSVTLKNINILRATNKFQNRPWFSNIAIAMDDAELFEYQSDNGTYIIDNGSNTTKSPFHLVLVQWYNFKSKKPPFIYGCPLLKLVEIYNFIEIEAIEEIVHIVPRFDTKDEYFSSPHNLIYSLSLTKCDIKGLFVEYVFDNPVTAVKSSRRTHEVVRWAEILDGDFCLGRRWEDIRKELYYQIEACKCQALDARRAHGTNGGWE
ncbi:hypothetical protein Glove_135g34 [Diversispora epigaea]|uniref:Uncharacterized protein n=1 Tax=Diversispora epigaea TaxID=1348612 RepID=A0A397IWS6_9GLOM|nr:hypothetical protein Glove_135g34 [Diversispora epigaea]